MTELTDPDPIDLEHRLDQTLARHLDPDMHWAAACGLPGSRQSLATELADAARAHFTGGAITALNENRGADPRVRICTGAAQLAEWATARIAEANGQIGDVSSVDEVGRELIDEVHEALGLLFAAGYAAMGELSVPPAPEGLARKVGRLLDDAAAPDGWIIVRPGHDFEALVERIVDTVREAMPVPEAQIVERSERFIPVEVPPRSETEHWRWLIYDTDRHVVLADSVRQDDVGRLVDTLNRDPSEWLARIVNDAEPF